MNPNAYKLGPLLNAEVSISLRIVVWLIVLDLQFQVLKIAQETGYSPAQILIAWSLSRGTSLVPKTIHHSRMTENLSAAPLEQGQIARIGRIAKVEGEVRFLDPSGHIGFDIFNELVDEPAL